MEQQMEKMQMSWGRFAATIATSTAVMFVFMYQLVYSAEHAMFSVNRLVSSLVMGCVMTAIMLAFMWSMLKGARIRTAVLVGAMTLGVILLWVNRGQSMIEDTRFMKSMIPHHSIAINNARKASITDPRVRTLADQIIASQVREIEEMRLLLDDIARNGTRGSTELPARTADLTPDLKAKAREVLR